MATLDPSLSLDNEFTRELEQKPDVDQELLEQQGPPPTSGDTQQQTPPIDATALMEQYGITPESVQEGYGNTQNWLEENVYVPLGARLRGRSEDEERAWRIQQQGEAQAKGQRFEEATEGTIPSEVARMMLGGGQDAIKSLGEFADLSGDSIKTKLAETLGHTVDPTQNPWHPEYQKGNWINIPYAVKENKTGWGKLGRGLIEFGLLTRWTGQAGRGLGAATGVTRTANATIAGNKYINFVAKGVRISAEGGAADLISSSSEMGNIANLLEEHTPWLLPQVMSMLAVRPEDNPWEARIKTVAAGAGMNHIAAFASALLRGSWRAIDGMRAGEAVDVANDAGNKVFKDTMQLELDLNENNATQTAANRYAEGRGIGRADARDEYLRQYLSPEDYQRYTNQATSEADRAVLDDLANKAGAESGDIFDFVEYRSQGQEAASLNRQPDPFVNPEGFSNSEKATYRGGLTKNVAGEAFSDAKKGGNGRTYTPIASEHQIRSIALGNAQLRTIVEEVTNDIANSIFHSKDLSKAIPKGMSYEEFVQESYKIAEPLLRQMDLWANGKQVDLEKVFKKIMKEGPEGRSFGMVDGEVVQTIGPIQKSANIIAIRSLGNLVSDLSTSALSISDDLPIQRQAEMIFDAMKVLFIENKKFGMMWGLDGQAQQIGFLLSPTLKQAKNVDLTRVQKQADEFFSALDEFRKGEDWEGLRDLLELNKLSDGRVRTLQHIYDFIDAKIYGGKMDGFNIRGQRRLQAQSTFFNSILSGLRTAPKAIIGTNMIGYSRPVFAAAGSIMRGNRKELAIAMSALDSMNRSFTESWKMWKYNWDLGINQKTQVYQGKFDIGQDMKEWGALRKHVIKYGTENEKMAYGFLDTAVKFNNSKWVKYSANAMGAGDAYARTVIGRQYMAQRAAQAALEEGIDPKNIKEFVRRKEELFRQEIFTKNKDGMWIVSDKAAAMAGNEAAMTTALEGAIKGFEQIAELPGMRAFFPFVRTGFNYLDVTFQHTPLGLLRDKYKELAKATPDLELLQTTYGIRPEDIFQERALLEGRMAAGSMATMALTTLALRGGITGDMPWDKKDRDLWKLHGIQPNSFKVPLPTGGHAYVSYKGIEIFNVLFAFGANTVYGAHLLGEKEVDHAQQKLKWMFTNVLVEQSMLGGLKDLMELSDVDSSDDMTMRAASRIARSWFPFKNLSSDLANIYDNTMREKETFWENLMGRDLVFRQQLHPMYDVLNKNRSGVEYQPNPQHPLLRIFNAISPVAIVFADDDPVREALIDIRFDLPEAVSDLGGIELDSAQRSALQRELSKGDLRKRLVELINSKAYKETLKNYKSDNRKTSDGWDLKTAWFYREVHKIFRDEKEIAKRNLLNDPKNSKLFQDIELKIRQKNALKSGDQRVIKNVDQELKKHGY